jgi:hypothetical protein
MCIPRQDQDRTEFRSMENGREWICRIDRRIHVGADGGPSGAMGGTRSLSDGQPTSSKAVALYL